MSDHPNDSQPRSPELLAKLRALGDEKSQGLDPYWKWGFCTGWNAAIEQAARATPADQELKCNCSVHLMSRTDVRHAADCPARGTPSFPTAEQIYAELKGVAVTRTSPENICDVLAVIKRLQAASKGDGND
jgi:hypothetical protein